MRGTPFAKTKARELRHSLNKSETLVWNFLRTHRWRGFHLTRQVPAEGYILDFACRSLRIAIEVDGPHHSESVQAWKDGQRQRALEAKGWRFIRITTQALWASRDSRNQTLRQLAADINNLAASCYNPVSHERRKLTFRQP